MLPNLLLPRLIAPVPRPPEWLKGDWRFGIGVGTKLPDLSRYRAHGTISGADWATGAHGKCLNFNKAVPDYVEIPASYTQLNFTTQDFSLVSRVYIDDLSANGRLFIRGDASVDGWDIYLHTSLLVVVETHQLGVGQVSYTNVGTIGTGQWYTIGFSRDGASVKIYIDGVYDSLFADTHLNPASCSRSAKIGVDDNKISNPFDGKIEFLRIFGRALPASEHLAYHNALA